MSSKKQIRAEKRLIDLKKRYTRRPSGPMFADPDGKAWTLIAGDPVTGHGVVLAETFGSAQGPQNRRPTAAVFKRDYSTLGQGPVGRG